MKLIVGAPLIPDKRMNQNFYYKLVNFLLKKNKNDEGFTLAELIVSGFVSLLVLIAGFTFLRMNLEVNKSDETNLKLGGKLNNALDFIVDEINSSKKVITKISDIPTTCRPLPPGELVLALKMPDQAKDNTAYQSNNMSSSNRSKYWIQISKECPIFYNLVRDTSFNVNGKPSYILKRTGPTVDEKGFYKATDIKTSVVVDKVKSSFGDDIICGLSTGNRRSIKKQIKGIVLCTDENGRGAEIMINAETPRNYSDLTITKSSGGYVRINDKDLINLNSTSGGGSGGIIQNGCQFFGSCITRKKLTYFIDVSGSMWSRNSKGQILMEVAKEKLINQLRAIPTNQGFILQIYKFNSYSVPLFSGGPQQYTPNNKQKAIQWVSRLRAGGGTSPWGGLNQAMQSDKVSQITILSDGITRSQGRCFHNGKYMNYSDCYAEYNLKRGQTNAGDVAIESVSLGFDFCSGNSLPWWYHRYNYQNYGYGKSWLGELASKNGGSCKHIQ